MIERMKNLLDQLWAVAPNARAALRSLRIPRGFFPAEARFVACMYGLILGFFALLRLVLLVCNQDQGQSIPSTLLALSFWIGLRFDLAVASYLLIPFFLLLLFVEERKRGRVLFGFCVLVGVVLLLGVIEAEFYRVFHCRLNGLAVACLGHPGRLAGLSGVRHGLLWIGLSLAFSGALLWLSRRLLSPRQYNPTPRAVMLRVMGAAVMLAMMVFVCRGGFGHDPLRLEDAVFCEARFANDLALNGVFTLARSAWDAMALSR